MYGASTLIMIRSIFRVVEYQQGRDGYLMYHEIFLYIFDATLMLAVMAVFSMVHPSGIGDLLGDAGKSAQRLELNDGIEFSQSVNA